MKSKPLTEKEITQQIRDVLKWAKVFHWKQWQGPMSQPKGVSDILGIYQGRMLAIEVKRENNQATIEQLRFIDTVNREGGIAFVARSAEEVIQKLNLNARLYPLFERGK